MNAGKCERAHIYWLEILNITVIWVFDATKSVLDVDCLSKFDQISWSSFVIIVKQFAEQRLYSVHIVRISYIFDKILRLVCVNYTGNLPQPKGECTAVPTFTLLIFCTSPSLWRCSRLYRWSKMMLSTLYKWDHSPPNAHRSQRQWSRVQNVPHSTHIVLW